MLVFDTHSHLYDHRFEVDFPGMLERARQAGVHRVLVLGDNLENSRKSIELARQHPMLLAAAGVHPGNADSWVDGALEELDTLLELSHVPVLGEIGLDYFHHKRNVPLQRRCFREQLALARRRGLPVSIHCRELTPGDCYNDLIADLEAEQAHEIRGVQHCFAGSSADARRLIDMGFHLGVGGSITYPKSGDLRNLIAELGPDRVILETDAPYLPPQPMRGKRNEPAFVIEAAKTCAALWGMTLEAVAQRTWQNGHEAFRVPLPPT